MGTAKLTEEQITFLKRHAKMAVWSYDADNAGRRAQKVAVGTLKKIMPCVEIFLPESKDPNELSADEVQKIYGGLGK
jgi:DNA primase